MRKLDALLVVDPADQPLGSDIEKAPSRYRPSGKAIAPGRAA
jgi:hypothetical protein